MVYAHAQYHILIGWDIWAVIVIFMSCTTTVAPKFSPQTLESAQFIHNNSKQNITAIHTQTHKQSFVSHCGIWQLNPGACWFLLVSPGIWHWAHSSNFLNSCHYPEAMLLTPPPIYPQHCFCLLMSPMLKSHSSINHQYFFLAWIIH